MSLLRLSKLAALLIPTACALVACMSSDTATTTSSSSSGGEGGAGGSSRFISTGTTSGPGGASATSGGTGTPDTSLHCTGDKDAWEQLTAGPIACTSGEECCVIMNPCLSEAQIVAAGHEAEAHAAWPSCTVDCNDCVARAIEVACVSGSCLGRVILGEPWSSPLRKDHCGMASEFLHANGGPMDVHFGCGAGPGP
jgi:hypothetical protein